MKKSMLVAAILVLALPAASGNWGLTEVQAAQGPQSCWGQATKVFAQMGEMGEHASEQGNPRIGLRNLMLLRRTGSTGSPTGPSGAFE